MWLWLVCAAQGYDQGACADEEEGGDGGADADKQARGRGLPPLGLVARCGGRGTGGRVGGGCGGDGEGVDGSDKVGEGPDGASEFAGEVVFGVAFHERLIGRGDRGPVVNVPHTGRGVANNNKTVEVFF